MNLIDTGNLLFFAEIHIVHIVSHLEFSRVNTNVAQFSSFFDDDLEGKGGKVFFIARLPLFQFAGFDKGFIRLLRQGDT